MTVLLVPSGMAGLCVEKKYAQTKRAGFPALLFILAHALFYLERVPDFLLPASTRLFAGGRLLPTGVESTGEVVSEPGTGVSGLTSRPSPPNTGESTFVSLAACRISCNDPSSLAPVS